MKFKDNIYLLLSYSNLSNIKINYPNFKTIAAINVLGFIICIFIQNFLARAIYVLFMIGINLLFKETRGIVISLSTITIWVFLFTSAAKVPQSWRRDIDVNTLYDWEEKLGLICFKFFKNDNVFLDLLAFLPYGIFHYAMPIITGISLMIWYKPTYVSVYLFFFGLMNSLGVITQLSWPTSPPWYYQKYGKMQANYTMHGDPAGLERIDDLFGLSLYTSSFTANPLPWGAWPSLHSGFASYTAAFLSYLFPKYSPLFILYVIWIWWATMYLGHHYFVDLLGGLAYAMLTVIPAIVILYIKKPVNEDYEELKSIVLYGENYTEGEGGGRNALSNSEKQKKHRNKNTEESYLIGNPSQEQMYNANSTSSYIGVENDESNLKITTDKDGILVVSSTTYSNSNSSSDGNCTRVSQNNNNLQSTDGMQMQMPMNANNNNETLNLFNSNNNNNNNHHYNNSNNHMDISNMSDFGVNENLLYVSQNRNNIAVSDAGTDIGTVINSDVSVINTTNPNINISQITETSPLPLDDGDGNQNQQQQGTSKSDDDNNNNINMN